jgi:hypothetical protein
VYQAIREELAAGGRVYIVCPLVSATTARAGASDGSDGEGGGGGGGGGDPKRAVVEEGERLRRAGVFGPAHRVGLLHGRMSGDEKAQALRDFSRWGRGGGAGAGVLGRCAWVGGARARPLHFPRNDPPGRPPSTPPPTLARTCAFPPTLAPSLPPLPPNPHPPPRPHPAPPAARRPC